MPENKIARAVAGQLNGLLVATSANPAGMAPACCVREAMGYFRGEIDAVIDGGPNTCQLPSTIVDITGKDITILREGMISVDKLSAFIAEIQKE